MLLRRSARRLRLRWLCLDPDRVHALAISRVAVRAPAYRGSPDLGTWLDERIDDAIEALLRTELEEERAGCPRPVSPDSRDEFLAEQLGLPCPLGRAASVAFNLLVPETRRVFFALAVLLMCWSFRLISAESEASVS